MILAYVFFCCHELRTIKLPKKCKYIGEGAFSNCLSLEEVILPEDMPICKTFLFSCCKSLKKQTIPENVKVIEESVFCNCKNLEEIILPYNLEKIGKFAIKNCPNLKKITWKGKIYTRKDEFNKDIKRISNNNITWV